MGSSMRLRVVYDDIHRMHRDPYGRHPENPWRLETALSSLMTSQAWDYIDLVKTPESDSRILELVHSRSYIDLIRSESGRGFHYIDSDTYVNEHTFTIASRYAAASHRAAISSLENREPWLVMPRPGGHHAGYSGWALGAPTLGFCVFNYAAIAAKTLEEKGYRVLIIDFDAHHGNGTQDIFWQDPGVIHLDIHQEGIYPGTGDIHEYGGGDAEGTKINIPLPAYSGDPEYLWILDHVIKPLIETTRPEAIVVSVGFDAYSGDPLTMLRATIETYSNIGQILRKYWIEGLLKALVINLEGGYGEGLSRGLRAFVEALLGVGGYGRTTTPRELPERIVKSLRVILERFWGINLPGI